MFTGLIQAVGRIVESESTDAGRRMIVDPGPWDATPVCGDSIAVNGVCLTATGDGSPLNFDVIGETLRSSSLGGLGEGDRVNLEASLRADGLLGGHVVQGHVDGVGRVVSVRTDADDWRVRIRPEDPSLMDFVAPKGSIAIEGVSLTVAAVGDAWLEIALIPTTLEKTTLGDLNEGQAVNIETDIVARTVVHFLRRQRAQD